MVEDAGNDGMHVEKVGTSNRSGEDAGTFVIGVAFIGLYVWEDDGPLLTKVVSAVVDNSVEADRHDRTFCNWRRREINEKQPSKKQKQKQNRSKKGGVEF